MKVLQTQNQLIIKENPGCLWLFSLFFAAFGILFVYGAFNGFILFGIQAPWAASLTFLLGLIGILMGFFVIYKTPINNLEIDKEKSEVAVISWRIFGKRTTIYHFDEIERFCLIENQNEVWSFGIEFSDGEKISLTSLGHYTEDFESKYVYPINIFIGKELPSFQLNFEPQDESEDEMS